MPYTYYDLFSSCEPQSIVSRVANTTITSYKPGTLYAPSSAPSYFTQEMRTQSSEKGDTSVNKNTSVYSSSTIYFTSYLTKGSTDSNSALDNSQTYNITESSLFQSTSYNSPTGESEYASDVHFYSVKSTFLWWPYSQTHTGHQFTSEFTTIEEIRTDETKTLFNDTSYTSIYFFNSWNVSPASGSPYTQYNSFISFYQTIGGVTYDKYGTTSSYQATSGVTQIVMNNHSNSSTNTGYNFSFSNETLYTQPLQIIVNTLTIGLMPGWSYIAPYPTTTSSQPISSIYEGGSSNGTKSFVTTTSNPTTLTSNSTQSNMGTTTGLAINTTTSSNTIPSRTFRGTATKTISETKTTWSSSTTSTGTVSKTVTSSTTRYPTAGEQVTQGSTFYLYSPPSIERTGLSTRQVYAIADTANNEYFWSHSGTGGLYEKGSTFSSTLFGTSNWNSTTTQGSSKTLNFTESWPKSTYTIISAGTSSGTTVSYTGTTTQEGEDLSVTVLYGSGTSTENQIFSRNIVTTEKTLTYGVETYTQVLDEDQYVEEIFSFVSLTTETGGVAVSWDGEKFTTGTHNVTKSLASTRNLFNKTRALTPYYTSVSILGEITIGSTVSNGFSSTGGVDSLSFFQLRFPLSFVCETVGLEAAGPRAQLPTELGFTANDGIHWGDAEKFYATGGMEGTILRTPIFTPMVTSKKTSNSSYTYRYESSLTAIVGKSLAESASSAGAVYFTSTFTNNTSTRVFGTNGGELYVVTTNKSLAGYNSYIASIFTVANDELWTVASGAFSLFSGGYRITEELSNGTSSTTRIYPRGTENSIGDGQSAIELVNFFSVYTWDSISQGLTPETGVGTVFFDSYTA